MTPKKLLLIMVPLLLVVVIVGMFLLDWFTTSTITISSSSDAQIFVKQGDKRFEQIGTRNATFQTKSTETVFIEARHDDDITQKSIQPKRRKTVEVSIDIRQPGKAELVSSVGPFLYPFIHQGYVYGISGSKTTGYMNVAPLEGNTSGEYPPIPFLPRLRQIAWHDINNFIYVTATEGAGVVSSNPSLQQSGLPYLGVAAPNASTTALLSTEGLHLAKGLDIKNARLLSRAKEGSWSYVFADDRYIFFGWTQYELDSDNHRDFGLNPPPETHEGGFEVELVSLSIFKHNGEEVENFALPIKSRVLRIASVNESTVGILAELGNFYLLDTRTGELQKKDFSFGRVDDLVGFQGRFMMLGSAGLWEYDVDDDSYYRVAEYPPAQGYVPYSLGVSEGNLYFSTLAEEKNSVKNRFTTNSVFRVRLDE